MEGEGGASRSKRALNRSEVSRLLAVWEEDARPLGLRNSALLRLMIYTGLRRAEVVALRWDDIDFEDQLVTVR
ncbi:MAG: tyrosine-type recombinase/integrase [Chloroflexi bacterium]|nr:tyrosine-type recombinase/integrase [Chloroflexota bacterium]